jgi:hypothetical protein
MRREQPARVGDLGLAIFGRSAVQVRPMRGGWFDGPRQRFVPALEDSGPPARPLVPSIACIERIDRTFRIAKVAPILPFGSTLEPS